MNTAQVLVIAHPREADAWEPALRARGFEVSSARTRKEAGTAASRISPAVVLVSEKLPMMGALRTTRSLRQDPATREAAVVLVGAHPFTVSQRVRLGLSAPDATVPQGATPDGVADAVVEVLRTGKPPPAVLTPAQLAGMKYSRIANLLMVMGVVFAMPSAGPAGHAFDRSWFIELIPLGGLVSDIATGRVDGRKRLFSWQGWAALAFLLVIALGIVLWPSVFRLR